MPNFKLTIRKSAGSANRHGSWVNTYEFEIPGDILAAEVDTVVNQTVALEKAVHLNDVHFIEARISLMRNAGDLNDGNGFRTFAIGGTGIISTAEGGDDNLPLNNVLVVQRQAGLGRKGELRYRRAISGFGWRDQAGQAVLEGGNVAAYQTLFDNYMAALPEGVRMVIVDDENGAAAVGREVSALVVMGIRARQVRNNRRPKIPQTPESIEERLEDALVLLGQLTAGIAMATAAGRVLAIPGLLSKAAQLGGAAGRVVAALPPAA